MALMNLLDVAIFNNAEDKPLIVEAANVAPEVGLIPAETIDGIFYNTQVVTALPTGSSFRAANNGVDATKAVVENRLVQAFIMNKRWGVDVQAGDGVKGGWQRLMSQQAMLHMQAALLDVGSQIFYGTTADANGFSGLLANVDSTMVVSAATATASTTSSVWGVRFGDSDVKLVLGNGGRIEITDPIEVATTGQNSKGMTIYQQEVRARVGLQIGNIRSIARIKNIPTGSTGLTDDLLDNLVECFAVGRSPDAIFMSRRSARQLKDSRTATTSTGAAAPWPDSIVGPGGKVIPLVITDSITNTETGDGA